METLGRLGERETIRRLAGLCPAGREVVTGIGDDAAVVRSGGPFDWVLTSDPVIEEVHFVREASGRQVGHKAAGRVLSDLAAMGAQPGWLLVDVEAPAGLCMDRLEEVYRGMNALAARHGAAVIGGDVAKGARLALHVFGVGKVPKGCAVLRSGGRAGDVLYVTGTLGGSRSGRHLDFEPRVTEGNWLREKAWASAMIDVSDGLAGDLGRLAEASRLRADLEGWRVPVADAARVSGESALQHALYDGEDFELLFAVSPAKAGAMEAAWADAFDLPCRRIGCLSRGTPGTIGLHAADGSCDMIHPVGFDHFAPPCGNGP